MHPTDWQKSQLSPALTGWETLKMLANLKQNGVS